MLFFFAFAFCHSFTHSRCLVLLIIAHSMRMCCSSWCENHIWFAKMIAVQIQMCWIANDCVCLLVFSSVGQCAYTFQRKEHIISPRKNTATAEFNWLSREKVRSIARFHAKYKRKCFETTYTLHTEWGKSVSKSSETARHGLARAQFYVLGNKNARNKHANFNKENGCELARSLFPAHRFHRLRRSNKNYRTWR